MFFLLAISCLYTTIRNTATLAFIWGRVCQHLTNIRQIFTIIYIIYLYTFFLQTFSLLCSLQKGSPKQLECTCVFTVKPK